MRKHSTRRSSKAVRTTAVFGIGLLLLGLYLLLLVIAPIKGFIAFSNVYSFNMSDDAADTRNRIQIEKIGLEVPFFEGGVEELEKGAWHRYPERGNPEKGGNFILSAHRFRIGITPGQTINNSPFYNIGVLAEGDGMRVFYSGKWYDYVVTKKYSVKPDAVYIEAPSSEAKLTLYSCTLGGSADGRDVIEARLR